ncbi:hypothetical protein RB195_011363 [Necator americanus]|uniref:Uncharacterized protein n=1 Tax=Necator americanus TaxID=51031 RepID=A0ABR1D216_NECAM
MYLIDRCGNWSKRRGCRGSLSVSRKEPPVDMVLAPFGRLSVDLKNADDVVIFALNCANLQKNLRRNQLLPTVRNPILINARKRRESGWSDNLSWMSSVIWAMC